MKDCSCQYYTEKLVAGPALGRLLTFLSNVLRCRCCSEKTNQKSPLPLRSAAPIFFYVISRAELSKQPGGVARTSWSLPLSETAGKSLSASLTFYAESLLRELYSRKTHFLGTFKGDYIIVAFVVNLEKTFALCRGGGELGRTDNGDVDHAFQLGQ